VDSPWQRYTDVVAGLAQVTQRGAEQVVRVLVRRGEIEASRSERAAEGLLSRMEQNRKAVVSIVRSEIEDAVRRIGLARQSDIDRLQAKITRLEAEIRSRPPGSAPERGSPEHATTTEATPAARDDVPLTQPADQEPA
jgi:polyhydroxyalkanoate synthesis regulator phasin